MCGCSSEQLEHEEALEVSVETNSDDRRAATFSIVLHILLAAELILLAEATSRLSGERFGPSGAAYRPPCWVQLGDLAHDEDAPATRPTRTAPQRAIGESWPPLPLELKPKGKLRGVKNQIVGRLFSGRLSRSTSRS